MCRTTVRAAIETYGDALNIAATGAIAKKGRTDEVRVISALNSHVFRPGILISRTINVPLHLL